MLLLLSFCVFFLNFVLSLSSLAPINGYWFHYYCYYYKLFINAYILTTVWLHLLCKWFILLENKWYYFYYNKHRARAQFCLPSLLIGETTLRGVKKKITSKGCYRYPSVHLGRIEHISIDQFNHNHESFLEEENYNPYQDPWHIQTTLTLVIWWILFI